MERKNKFKLSFDTRFGKVKLDAWSVAILTATGIYTAENILEFSTYDFVEDKVKDLINRDLTSEQNRAQDYFVLASDDQFVKDIVVGDERINLRNRPSTEKGKEPTGSDGEVVGHLQAGARIQKALVTEGNDPSVPFDKSKSSYWYVFPNPNKPTEMVFAAHDVFEPKAEVYMVKPIDLAQDVLK